MASCDSRAKDALYCRKEKSLCTNFLRLYDREGVDSIGLDCAALQLGVEQRRIYDIVNILEGIGKKEKNQYTWKGSSAISGALEVLKEQGQKEEFHTYISNVSNEKEHSILSDSKSCSDKCSKSDKGAMVTRLYDIANVFSSLGLIEKRTCHLQCLPLGGKRSRKGKEHVESSRWFDDPRLRGGGLHNFGHTCINGFCLKEWLGQIFVELISKEEVVELNLEDLKSLLIELSKHKEKEDEKYRIDKSGTAEGFLYDLLHMLAADYDNNDDERITPSAPIRLVTFIVKSISLEFILIKTF